MEPLKPDHIGPLVEAVGQLIDRKICDALKLDERLAAIEAGSPASHQRQLSRHADQLGKLQDELRALQREMKK